LRSRRRESLGDLGRDVERLPRRQRRLHALAQRFADEQLQYGIRHALLNAEVVDRQDVRMRERRDGLRFALEAFACVGVDGQVRRQDLDRHVAGEPGVVGTVHLAHPACAQRCQDLVLTEGLADHDQVLAGLRRASP
jgi:hypothetical protein